jgi:hypothetical protein
VLSTLYAKYPGEPSVLTRYARVAMRTGGADAAGEACAAAGAAAALYAAAGQATAAVEALALCPKGPVAARDAAGTPPRGLAAAAACDAAAATVLRDAAAAGADKRARADIGTAFVTRDGAGCRGTKLYVETVSALQNADPYNPHLHTEWARLLREMPGRGAEAAQHMAFAISVFEHAASEGRRTPDGLVAARAGAAARAEMASWTGTEAGPRSVRNHYSAQLRQDEL